MTRFERLETSLNAIALRGEFEIFEVETIADGVDIGADGEIVIPLGQQWGVVGVEVSSGEDALPLDQPLILSAILGSFDELVLEEIVPGGSVQLASQPGELHIRIWRGSAKSPETDTFHVVVVPR